jgi:conjugative relaxase-like TrwC/TraI family protein
MLSFPKGGLKGSAADIVSYLEGRELVKDNERGYYAGRGAPSQWGGTLATTMGLAGPVDAKIFKDLLEGRTPDGAEFAEASPDRRMGKDLTFNAPKSVSLAALVGGDKAVLEAHDRANRKAMEWMQREFVTARYGKGGKEVERTGEAVWASYRHEDTRTAGGQADPHLHTHNVLLNVTRGRGGELRALDLDFGVDGVHLAGAIYQAELAKALQALGYSLRKTENGFELAGVTDAQIAEFSARSAQIVEELNRKGLDRKTASASQKVAANMATRESKSGLSQDDLRWEWRARGREMGMALDGLKGIQAEGHEALSLSASAALAHATDHLSERESVINSQSTKLHALRAGVLDGVTIDTLETEIAAARGAGNLIDAGAGRFVTRATLEREAAILETTRVGRGIMSPLTDERGAQTRIAARERSSGFRFTDGQREAVLQALTTRDQFYGIRGAAGAGKSTAMAALADEAHARGLRVIGLGPSQTAADGLKEIHADDCRTLASFCQRDEKDLTPRLLILDEAGMVSARDWEAFLQKVRPTDHVRFVGDDLQLAAVEAGSPFSQVMKEGAIQFSEITEINRQKDAGLLAVAQAFADGRNAEAVRLAEPYMTSVTVTDDEALEAPASSDFKTVRDWLDAHSGSELGYEGLEKAGKAKLAPPAVRVQAIARETADTYLRLSPDERARTLVMAATHDMRKSINSRIRAGLNPEAGTGSVTVTALDKSTLTRAQLRQAVHYKAGQILRVPEGRGKTRKVVDWTITANDPTRNTLTARNAEGQEKVFHPRDLDPKRVGLYSPRTLDLSPGDRILFTENNRSAGFQNNETGTVVVAENGKVEIQKDNGQTVAIDPQNQKTHTLDYGWAVTVHRSQGRTIDRAFVAGMASKVATAALAYVACTRERWHLQIFTDNIKKLQQAWARVADRATALDATRAAAQGQEPDALQKAREQVRSQLPEHPQQQETQEVEQEAEPIPAPARRRDRGMDFELEM